MHTQRVMGFCALVIAAFVVIHLQDAKAVIPPPGPVVRAKSICTGNVCGGFGPGLKTGTITQTVEKCDYLPNQPTVEVCLSDPTENCQEAANDTGGVRYVYCDGKYVVEVFPFLLGDCYSAFTACTQ